jgi:glucose/arabinose dehydrogenase
MAIAMATAWGGAGCGGDEGGAPAPSTGPARSQPDTGNGRGGVRLTELGRFEAPVYVAQPPGEKSDLYVVEQGGRIRLVDDGEVVEEPFLDISGQVTYGGGRSEQGLLSVAFAPDYADSGLFYVYFTDRSGDYQRLHEYRRSPDAKRADLSSERLVLRMFDPAPNHNGGLLLFGPDDLLYVGTGDGGGFGDPGRQGQDLTSLLGKLLRIDPRPREGRPYGIPPDNPYVHDDRARPEIYAYGLRNPWRFSFDRETDALYIGDVGEKTFEEIDYSGRGKGGAPNFGWSAYEGEKRFNEDQEAPGHVLPIQRYPREGENCAVTGGYVVRDERLEALDGRYLYADFCAGELRSFVPASGGARGDRRVGLSVPSVSSFGEDNRRRIYVVSLDGPVYRLDPRRSR